jgi:hypothetical protein
MNISRYPLTNDLWAVVAPLIGDSFFGSRGFADLWRTKGGKPMYWVAEDAQRILAVLPGVEFGIKPFQRLYAMPNGCYARLFYNPQMTVEKERIARMMLDSLTAARYVKLFIYDFYNSLVPDSRFDIQTATTTLVDISGPDWRPPDSKLRAEIRKAVREGIQVVAFDWNQHHRQFFHLMKLTAERHGQEPRHNPEFFEAMAELTRADNRVQWVWCEHDGRPVSSHIFFIDNATLQGWQMYSDKAFSFLKPNQYILFTMCRRMARQGVTKLNLGVTPDDADGVAFYKKRWGGNPVQYYCYVMKRGIGRFF